MQLKSNKEGFAYDCLYLNLIVLPTASASSYSDPAKIN